MLRRIALLRLSIALLAISALLLGRILASAAAAAAAVVIIGRHVEGWCLGESGTGTERGGRFVEALDARNTKDGRDRKMVCRHKTALSLSRSCTVEMLKQRTEELRPVLNRSSE